MTRFGGDSQSRPCKRTSPHRGFGAVSPGFTAAALQTKEPDHGPSPSHAIAAGTSATAGRKASEQGEVADRAANAHHRPQGNPPATDRAPQGGVKSNQTL